MIYYINPFVAICTGCEYAYTCMHVRMGERTCVCVYVLCSFNYHSKHPRHCLMYEFESLFKFFAKLKARMTTVHHFQHPNWRASRKSTRTDPAGRNKEQCCNRFQTPNHGT